MITRTDLTLRTEEVKLAMIMKDPAMVQLSAMIDEEILLEIDLTVTEEMKGKRLNQEIGYAMMLEIHPGDLGIEE